MIRSLLAGAIDYAGLFPPAGLPMPAAARNFAAYAAGPDAWALGRFVVPAARLGELASAAEPLGAGAGRWRISALVAGDGAADLVAISAFNAQYESRGTGWSAVVDTVEARAATPAEVQQLVAHIPRDLTAFVEVPAAGDAAPVLEAVARAGHAAKIRTGGVTPAQFPTAEQIARFLRTCARLGMPFKATAGLHHPLRGEYPLTYEAGSARGTMFGFLNVLLAAAGAHAGGQEGELVEMLEERDPTAFEIGEGLIQWRGHRLTEVEFAATRAQFALSFGSCSFDEPLADLRTLGWLPSA